MMKKEVKTMVENVNYTVKGYRAKNDINGNPIYRIQIFSYDGENITSQAKGLNGRYYKNGDFLRLQSYNIDRDVNSILEKLEGKKLLEEKEEPSYKFYVITKICEEFKKFKTMREAMEYFNTLDYDRYKALGVEKICSSLKFGVGSCDLLINNPENQKKFWVSKDCNTMESFKDDKLITVNAVNILKEKYILE